MGSSISFRDMLINGLRSDDRAGVGEQFATEYLNWKPTPKGLRSFPQPTALIASLPTAANHPYPQLFKGMGDTILLYQTALHDINESGWTAAAASTIYVLTNSGSTTTINSGGIWHYIDMHTGWIATNGTVSLIRTGWVDSSKTFEDANVVFQTGCSFRGRVLCGGFDSNFWSAGGSGTQVKTWTDIWTDLLKRGQGLGLGALGTPDKNWVSWSSVGIADIPLLVMLPDQAIAGQGISGAHSSNERSLWMDLSRRNEHGMRPMDWQGTVQVMKSLTSGVMVYGTDGVSALIPASEPFPIFGLREGILKNGLGVAGRGAVGGDEHIHLMIDINGTAWTIDSTFVATRLGYEEFFAVSVASTNSLRITYDSNRKEFYIVDDDNCYILSESGVSKVPYMVLDGVHVDKGSGGSFHVITDASASTTTDTNKNTGTWQSEVVRLGRQQTIQKVLLTGTDNADISIKFEFRNDNDEVVMTSSTVATDDRGCAYLPLSCVEFSLILTASNSPINVVDVSLDDIEVFFMDGGKISLKERINN